MKKQSKYRKRQMELKAMSQEYVKGFTLTKKEKQALKEWIKSGNSPYDGNYGLFEYMDFISSLRAQDELDDLLKGLTNSEKDYVESYCISFDPCLGVSYFDFDKFKELDLKHLPVDTDDEKIVLNMNYDEFPF